MGWSRIENGIKRNPKILKVSPSAKIFYIWGILHCNEMATDGFIDDSIVPILAIEVGDMNYEPYLHELTLVQTGQRFPLLERVDSGYMIHNYLEYNLSHEQVEERAKVHAEVSRKGGKASAVARWGYVFDDNRIVTEGLTELSPNDNRTVTEGVTELSPEFNHINKNKNINKKKNQDKPGIALFAKTASPVFSSKPLFDIQAEDTPTTKKPKDTRDDHPAIKAFRTVYKEPPKKEIKDLLIIWIGETPDVEKLQTCYDTWIGMGWKRNNLAWVREWYKNGIPSLKGNGNGSKPKGYTETCPPGDSDPEVIYKKSIKETI